MNWTVIAAIVVTFLLSALLSSLPEKAPETKQLWFIAVRITVYAALLVWLVVK